jgi:hypothetical protein
MTSRLRFRLALAAGLAAAVIGPALLPAVAGAGPSCGITWGSLPKSTLEMTGAPLTGARTGHHDCYDRFVVDVAGYPAAGYEVRYIDPPTGPTDRATPSSSPAAPCCKSSCGRRPMTPTPTPPSPGAARAR